VPLSGPFGIVDVEGSRRSAIFFERTGEWHKFLLEYGLTQLMCI